MYICFSCINALTDEAISLVFFNWVSLLFSIAKGICFIIHYKISLTWLNLLIIQSVKWAQALHGVDYDALTILSINYYTTWSHLECNIKW